MRQASSRGQALAEVAIVLPVFLLFVIGTVDFGRAIYYYSVISNGSREGARYAIVHGSLAQTLDGSCGSGPGTNATTKDSLGALVVEATGANAPGWAAVPAGCAPPATVPAVGLDLSQYSASACWSGSNPDTPCTVPSDCSGPVATNSGPANSLNVPVTVRTCYRFQPILTSVLHVGPISLSAQTTLYVTH